MICKIEYLFFLLMQPVSALFVINGRAYIKYITEIPSEKLQSTAVLTPIEQFAEKVNGRYIMYRYNDQNYKHIDALYYIMSIKRLKQLVSRTQRLTGYWLIVKYEADCMTLKSVSIDDPIMEACSDFLCDDLRDQLAV